MGERLSRKLNQIESVDSESFVCQEKVIIDVASGKVSRIELSEWINKDMVVRHDPT